MNAIDTRFDATMSSREIAALADKQHKHVLDDCRKMFEELGLQSAEFSADYQDSRKRVQQEYILGFELTMTLVAGYSLKLRHRIVQRWRELETGIRETAGSIPDVQQYDDLESAKRMMDLLGEVRKLAASTPLDMLPGLKKTFVDALTVYPGAKVIDGVPHFSTDSIARELGIAVNQLGRIANEAQLREDKYGGRFVIYTGNRTTSSKGQWLWNPEGVEALKRAAARIDNALTLK